MSDRHDENVLVVEDCDHLKYGYTARADTHEVTHGEPAERPIDRLFD
ncbi:hypothetical protein AB0L57_32185 [Nocardia sp. NPDC052254]